MQQVSQHRASVSAIAVLRTCTPARMILDFCALLALRDDISKYHWQPQQDVMSNHTIKSSLHQSGPAGHSPTHAQGIVVGLRQIVVVHHTGEKLFVQAVFQVAYVFKKSKGTMQERSLPIQKLPRARADCASRNKAGVPFPKPRTSLPG